jgi:diaminopimelate decarboxylase
MSVHPPPDCACHYKGNLLHVEDLPVTELAAKFGTPLYVYSHAALRRQYDTLMTSLSGLAQRVLVCYALKANANPTLGGLLARWGVGADVVSGGELYLARRMGFPPERIVFAGVGKTKREMAEALHAGVRSFHVESAGELEALADVAAGLGVMAPVAVRVNPDVPAHTHPYITTGTRTDKFGVPPEQALAMMRRAAAHPSLRPVGLHAHVGSQLLHVQPIVEATRVLLQLWDQLLSEGVPLHELDIGGGLGIPYRPEDRPEGPHALAEGLRPLLAGRTLELVIEPGRYLMGPAGALLTSVLYVKRSGGNGEGKGGRSLVVVDAGMNDLLRPALYGAWHPVWPAREEQLDPPEAEGAGVIDVVGPVCESADVLARERRLGPIEIGDVLAIGQAGAYGFCMASQYNARPRPAEVLVSGSQVRLIRRRETYEDLWPQV